MHWYMVIKFLHITAVIALVDGTIVEIDILADPVRLRQPDLAILNEDKAGQAA